MDKPSPLPLTLRQLQYAVAVRGHLGFRRAAEACNVSQPSLSAQIAELERGLGVVLFERDRRRVLESTAGRELLDRAQALLRDAADLVAAARQHADPHTGQIRLGIIPTVSAYLLPTLTRGLVDAFPELTVLWDEDKTETLMHKLERGELEGALVALESEIGDVEREVIGVDPFVLATPRGHPLGSKKARAWPKELRELNVLLLDDGHCFRDQALELCTRAKAVELEFRATSLSTLAQMVASGAGVTLLPKLAVPVEAARADLVVRGFRDPAPARTLAFVWRQHSVAGVRVQPLGSVARRALREASRRSVSNAGP